MGAYKYLNNFAVNLAQAKEFSLRRKGSLAQAKSFRLSEFENREHFEFSLKLARLAQARGLCLGEHLKPNVASYCHSRLGESSLLRRELLVWGKNSFLR